MFQLGRFTGMLRDMTETEKASARQALVSFCHTFAFVKPEGVGAPDTMSVDELSALAQSLTWRALAFGRAEAVAQSSLDSWFRVKLNGVTFDMPRYTLMTMRHCITGSKDGGIDLFVETAHWQRIQNELVGDAVFLDVGAAAGTMCVPYAISGGAGLRTFAFEPSRRARNYLEATIQRNRIANIVVLAAAVSDAVAEAEFMEFPEDDTGLVPYLPEASRLSVAGEGAVYEKQVTYPVEVTTLDTLMPTFGLRPGQKVVVKIDVEGFEDKVLIGGQALIAAHKPFFSIDIHVHPGTNVLTDGACERLLAPHGYAFERRDHVIFAIPPG